MNEKIIRVRLMQMTLNRLNHQASIPNSTQLLYNEADLLSVTKAGLVHEYEIKCSKANYNSEFKTKKRKHWWLKNAKQFGNTGAVANYFWFVTYEFDIEPPEYAGWILASSYDYKKENYLQLREKKKAPRLHGHKWDAEKVAKIARLLSFRLLKEYENGTGTN